MRGEIILIGDELVSGRTRDENGYYLATRLGSLGLVVTALSYVGDDEPRIRELLARAGQRSEFVLVSGGLGATDDDITARTAASFFGRPLVLDQDLLAFIRRAVEERGLTWSQAYEKLALLPQGARLIDSQGYASGFSLEHDGIPFFFMPGIPAEVRLLTESKVLPLLAGYDKDKAVIRQRVFKLFGLDEPEIGCLLSPVAEPGLLVGFYPAFPENHVALTVRRATAARAAAALDRAAEKVRAIVGKWIVAEDEDTLEANLGRLLAAKGLKIAVAESCTGGLIGHRLTQAPGASRYFDRGAVCYSNQAKREMLGVEEQTLDAHGAVSEETARAMAQGILARSGADIALAVTGIAGPEGGSPEKPVGTVIIALARGEEVSARRFLFSGGRREIKLLTAETALDLVRRALLP